MTDTKTNELTNEEQALLDARMKEYHDLKEEWLRHVKMGSSWDILEALRGELAEVERSGFFEGSSIKKPLKGMPCTYHIGSDSYAYQVVDVRRKGQEVEIVAFPDGNREHAMTLTRRKTQWGQIYYKEKGRDCGSVTFFVAKTHLDPSF